MAAWFMGWSSMILWSYPEIFLAVACFFLIHIVRSKDRVVVNWPLVGMLPSLLLNAHRLHDWFTEVMAGSGLTLMFHGPWFTRMDSLFTCDPANINHVMCTRFSNFPKGADFCQIFELLGDGIFNSESDSWRLQRKMAIAHLKCGRFRGFMATILTQKVEKVLIPLLEHVERRGEYVDLQDVFQRFTFDTTCALVLGTDPGCLSINFPEVPIVKAMDDAAEAVMFRHLLPESWWRLLSWLKIGKERKMYEAWKTIDDFIYHCISTRRQEMRKITVNDGCLEESGDLLTSYMEEMQGSKTDKFLRDTTVNFLFAGKDTGSSGLTWFFWMISKNPRAEAKILEELRSIAETKGEAKPAVFDAEELTGLVYLHAALCESLRLFPPVPFEHKGVSQPDVLPSGEAVRGDTKIMFPLYSMGRMESIWGKDCLEFRPERWITDRGSLKFEPSYKFAVFNAGPRNCAGKDVAFTQMKVVAAALLYNFHVHVMDGHPVLPKLSVVLHMKDGLMVQITERKRSS